jgi:hypothetical protein
MSIKKLEILANKINTLSLMIKHFKEDDGDGLITYQQLKNIGYDEKIDLENGVSFIRTFHPEKEVYFITNMNPNISNKKKAEFGKQWHDCLEYCEVIEGHLIDIITNKKYLKGEIVVYEPFVIHKPTSLISSKYGVEFKNPVNNE